jgi:hypothetical protein
MNVQSKYWQELGDPQPGSEGGVPNMAPRPLVKTLPSPPAPPEPPVHSAMVGEEIGFVLPAIPGGTYKAFFNGADVSATQRLVGSAILFPVPGVATNLLYPAEIRDGAGNAIVQSNVYIIP